jgi:ATP-dependent DNA helicase 2 subunit 2
MDLIVTKLGPTSKGNKRILLVTDGETLVKEPEEGTKEDQVMSLADQMQRQGISLDAVVIRLRGSSISVQSKASQENEFLLRKFASRTKGELISTETYTSLLGAIKSRQVSPTTLYRGELELTPKMSVKVICPTHCFYPAENWNVLMICTSFHGCVFMFW